MKPLLVRISIVFLSFLPIALALSAAPNPINIQKYHIYLNWQSVDKPIDVECVLTIDITDKTDRFWLLYNGQYPFTMARLAIDGRLIDPKINYISPDTMILHFGSKLALGKEIFAEFRYSIPFDSTMRPFLLNREDLWYPVLYDDLADILCHADIPMQYRLFSNMYLSAAQLSGRRRFSVRTDIFNVERFFIMAFVKADGLQKTYGRSHAKRYPSPLMMEMYALSSDTTILDPIFDQLGSSGDYFSDLLGEPFDITSYPLNIVEVAGLQDVLSYKSLILVGSSYMEKGDDPDFAGWPAREMAHQWIGTDNMPVKSDTPGCAFLRESMAEYLRLLYIGNRYGKDSLETTMVDYANQYNVVLDSPDNLPLKDIVTPSNEILRTAVYRHGPLALYKIFHSENYKWGMSIRDFYDTYKDHIITLSDFKNYLARYDRDGTLLPKVDEWLSELSLP